MATLIVTTAQDVVNAGDGVLSLREAVAQSNGTAELDTIQFAASLEGQTLVLTGGELVLTSDGTINGDPDSDGLGVSISGNNTSRILDIRGLDTDVSVA